MTANHLYDVPDLPDKITEAAKDGELVLFVGSGLSIQVGLPSWDDLANNALEQLIDKKVINYSDKEQLISLNDPKKKLSVALILADKHKKDLDLISPLTVVPEDGEGIYQYVNDIGCSCVTTNYDKLLTPRYKEQSSEEDDTTFSESNRITTINKHLYTKLCTPGSVIHIHGSIDNQKTMIVSTADYLSHYDNEYMQYFLGELFEKKVVLFIGYGLEESEILEHILRRGGVRSTSHEIKRFILQGYYRSHEPLYQNLCEYYLHSFGVDLIGYSMDQHGRGQLVEILRRWSEEIEVRPQALTDDLNLIDEVTRDD